MSPVLYVLGVWILASVPVALCLGWLCGLNQLSLDEEVTHVALIETHNPWERDVHRGAALGAAHPGADMTPA